MSTVGLADLFTLVTPPAPRHARLVQGRYSSCADVSVADPSDIAALKPPPVPAVFEEQERIVPLVNASPWGQLLVIKERET